MAGGTSWLEQHVTAIVVSVVAAVVAAIIIAYFGIGRSESDSRSGSPSVTIDGPATVSVATPIFVLSGRSSGEIVEAYWTDTFGVRITEPVPTMLSELFQCPDLGEFAVSLTVVDSDGRIASARHELTCR